MLLSDCIAFRICTTIVLEEVYNDYGHVVRPNAICLPHFLECSRTYLIKKIVVGVVNVLDSSTVDR